MTSGKRQREEQASMDDREVDDGDDVVTFNLRGERFTVAKRTLRAFPDSLLATLAAAPRNSPSRVVPDENGEYAIDRDPQYFEAMLQLYQQDAWPPEKLRLHKVRKNVYFTSASHEMYYDVTTTSVDDDDADEDAQGNRAALVAAVLAATTTVTYWEGFCDEVAYYQLQSAAATVGLPTVSGSDKLIPSQWWVELKPRLVEKQRMAHRHAVVREWCSSIMEQLVRQLADSLSKASLCNMNRSGQHAREIPFRGGVALEPPMGQSFIFVATANYRQELVAGDRRVQIADSFTVHDESKQIRLYAFEGNATFSKLDQIRLDDDLFEALRQSLASIGYELTYLANAVLIYKNYNRVPAYEIK